jgi:uncharacterized lipoprotein YehR (DUF1307 family)
MKKMITLLLAGMMVFSMAACGGGQKQETSAPATEAAGSDSNHRFSEFPRKQMGRSL